MTTWILILTLFARDHYAGTAASVQSVTGFKSRESCLVAANMWLRQMRDRDYTRFNARAMCTPQ
jgi:hypothetical protein